VGGGCGQKRGPDWVSGVEYERGSGNLSPEVEENSLEVVLVEGSVAPRSRVDLAGDALGVVVDAAGETVAEELALVASDALVANLEPAYKFIMPNSRNAVARMHSTI